MARENRALYFLGVMMEKDLLEKSEDFNETGEGTKVLCGASAYEKKFYLNEEFNSLPERVKPTSGHFRISILGAKRTLSTEAWTMMSR